MSALNVSTINGVDVQNLAKQTARAWVNFNGSGVIAINSAYNVASITDNGVGDYTVNFSAAMPTATYAVVGTAQDKAASGTPASFQRRFGSALTTLAARFTYRDPSGSFDTTEVCVVVFG